MEKLYAIVRTDIKMPKGKMAAQAGHAFLEAFRHSGKDELVAYCSNPPGTKVVLGGTLKQINTLYDRCQWLHVPCALIVDSGHVCPPDFDGSPVVTALGIGLDKRAENMLHHLHLLGDNDNEAD